MTDLVERLRLGSHEQESDFAMHEAADEIELLRKKIETYGRLVDYDTKAMEKHWDELADARRHAFIEAAEHLEASGEWRAVPVGPYGAATAEWVGPSVHELAAALIAKAEGLEPVQPEPQTWGWFMEDIDIIYGPDGTFWNVKTGQNMSEWLMDMEEEKRANKEAQP